MMERICKKLSLDEIYMELCSYRAMGIDAYYIYNGTRLDNTMDFAELKEEIHRLIVGISKEEYIIRKETNKLTNSIVEQKKITCASTKFFINSVSRILPDNLKDNWEIDCYYGLCNGLNDDIIKRISFLLIALYENKDEEQLLSLFRNTILFINNNYDMLQIIDFLKKYGVNQDFLRRYIYMNVEEDDDKRDYDRFYYSLKKGNSTLIKIKK